MQTLIRIALVSTLAAGALASAEQIERNFETTANPSVSIDNKKGSVTVVGWEENRVRVTGTVGNDVTRVDIDDDDDNVEIDVVSSRWKSRDAEARLTIYVPQQSSIEIETVSAPIDVSGVSGDALELQTTSGTIEVDGGFRTAEVEGVSSSIRLKNATGDLSVTNVSGKVEVQGRLDTLEIEVISGGVDAEVHAQSIQVESVSSTIRLDAHVTDDVQGESVSGSIKFSGSLGPDGEMEFHVLSGSVSVEFSEPAYGEYRLSTFSGGITCDLEPLSDLQRDGKRMQFEYGDGDRSVELESFSGSVSVR